jgi:predicted RND superfamily exporter protein
MKTVFVTYNPSSDFEQTLAIRLHTIGASTGFRMYLPERFNSENILDDETKSRISKADYVVMFSISPLSAVVKQEIEFAFDVLKDKSKIVVIYDKQRGKNLRGNSASHFTPIYIDQFDADQQKVLLQIINTIRHKESKHQTKQVRQLQQEKESTQALTALFGIGLGLLMLGTLSSKN